MSDRIWAPWRLKYIEADGPPSSGCIFVELPAQDNDRENLILHRGKTAFVILNRYPYTNGHLMVAPYKHTANLSELTDEELDVRYPAFDEDERPIEGQTTSVREMLTEHGSEPSWLCGRDW